MPQVAGIVVEKWTRRPVSGVKVSVGHYVGLTDTMGRFNIEAPAGSHQVQIAKTGFYPIVMPLSLLGPTNMGTISIDSVVRAL